MAKLEQISRNGKIGYKSSNGTIIIEPRFDDGIRTFGIDSSHYSEYAQVSMKGKCGMINESGNIIIPFEYEEVYHLFDDFFAVRKRLPGMIWSYGVIKPDGTVIVPFEYKMITKVGRFFECFKEAISTKISTYNTRFDTNGRVFRYSQEKDPVVYNSQGKMIYDGPAIDSKFDYIVVNKNDKYGVIDQEGNHIVEIKYEDAIIASPNRFIVRRSDRDSWLFGVVDSKANVIIDFTYKYITSSNGAFFDCFKECDSTFIDSRSWGERYKYIKKKQEIWLNSIGEEVYQGEAEALSEELLECNKDGKKAVINQKGKKIVNYLYDTIQLLDKYLIVEKDSKVGVLTDYGSVVIDALYNNIEFVHIDDSVSTRYNDSRGKDEEVYGRYSKKHPFDTAADEDHLNRQVMQWHKRKATPIFIKSINYSYCTCPQRNHYSFNDIMILRTEAYAELFSIEEGIVHNSRFDTIKQLTDLSYVVSKDGKYGVYRRDVHCLIIDCEYERIIFEGGHVVLLFKDGLWGAKTLVLPSYPTYEMLKADVPIQFKEISILNSAENLFGVNEGIEEYTIVDEEGNVYKKMDKFFDLSTMPVLYDLNHILTSHNEKYGFVSVNGYESVPFIYDEILERDDSLFDVRIEASWGVIDLLGKVIVPVKYSKAIPSVFDNAIVSETLSDCLGVLGEDGKEKIPTVYEHLMMRDRIIYCGYGGLENDSYKHSNNNFFSGDIDYACWGVLSKDGNLIIEPIYDCFKEQDGYILAGRDGNFLGEGQHGFSYHESEYGGVYDLFDYEGNLILGGFNKFHKDEEQNLLYFHFGGGWKQECENYDEYGNAIFDHSYHWKEGNGRWLVTDMNLTSIIPKEDGSTFTFRKGATCKITRKEEDGKITNYWSFPLEQLSVLKPVFTMGCFVVGDNNRQRVIRYKDRATSRFYNKVKIINKDNFFTYERKENYSGVGISSCEQELIGCNKCYLLLTEPVLNSVFAVQKIDNDNYSVLLLDTQNAESFITAIDKIDYCDLVELLRDGKLQLLTNNDSVDDKSISVRDISIFNESFVSALKIEERNDTVYENAQYWFSEEIIVSSKRNDDNNDYYGKRDDNDWDYERETWDAMTDGMYGDMPEGFDGDYDFLGF